MWLAYFLGTVLIEAAILRLADRKNRQRPHLARHMKLTGYVNLVTYGIILPFWIVAQYPRFGDFTPVPVSNKTPGIRQLLVYHRPDGSIWLGDTWGNQVSRIADLPELTYDQFVGLRTTEDAGELIAVVARRTRAETPLETQDNNEITQVPGAAENVPEDQPRWIVSDEEELARFDLSTLDEDLRQTAEPNLKLGYPDWKLEPYSMHDPVYTWRDGTMAAYYSYQYDYVRFYLDADADISLEDLRDAENTSSLFTGFVPPQYPFRISEPKALPGGRYALVECSGEIVLLDIEERKAFILFTGSDSHPLVKPTRFVSWQQLKDHPGEMVIWE
jgi:hypothetical protein